jgi:hypothetical protein
MTVKYALLFTIGLWHDYYANGACKDFAWLPDAATIKLLAGYNALCKWVGNSLVVLIKTDDEGRPFVPLQPGDKFTFYMDLQKPQFITVSNLGNAFENGNRFYFTNRYQNKVVAAPAAPLRMLSQPLPAYQAAPTYQPGQLVTHSNSCFENIKTATDIAPPAATHWALRQGSQYASSADLVQFINPTTTIKLPAPVAAVEVVLLAFDAATQAFSKKVFENRQQYGMPVNEAAVNFNGVAAGKYQMLVNGATSWVYICTDATAYFGVCEIFNEPFADAAFNLLDAQGKTKTGANELHYRLAFANRLARWKYITPNKGVVAVQGSAGYSFTGNAPEADYFESVQPIPLSEKAYDFKLDLKRKISTDPPPAPNPNIQASGMLSFQNNMYYCNIYLNY